MIKLSMNSDKLSSGLTENVPAPVDTLGSLLFSNANKCTPKVIKFSSHMLRYGNPNRVEKWSIAQSWITMTDVYHMGMKYNLVGKGYTDHDLLWIAHMWLNDALSDNPQGLSISQIISA